MAIAKVSIRETVNGWDSCPWRVARFQQGRGAIFHPDTGGNNGAEPDIPARPEYFHLAAPSNIDSLEAGVHDYVNYYNHERIKLRLNGLSPVEYRKRNTA